MTYLPTCKMHGVILCKSTETGEEMSQQSITEIPIVNDNDASKAQHPCTAGTE